MATITKHNAETIEEDAASILARMPLNVPAVAAATGYPEEFIYAAVHTNDIPYNQDGKRRPISFDGAKLAAIKAGLDRRAKRLEGNSTSKRAREVIEELGSRLTAAEHRIEELEKSAEQIEALADRVAKAEKAVEREITQYRRKTDMQIETLNIRTNALLKQAKESKGEHSAIDGPMRRIESANHDEAPAEIPEIRPAAFDLLEQQK